MINDNVEGWAPKCQNVGLQWNTGEKRKNWEKDVRPGSTSKPRFRCHR